MIECRAEQLGRATIALERRMGGTSLADRVRQGEDLTAELMFHLEHCLQDVAAEAMDDARYAPYLARQQAEVERLRTEANTDLSRIVSYRAIGGLSNEMVERLEAARPADLSAASRIRGITPAALAAILVAAQRRAA
jgi:tRNA uridine 5-carboxymethylaminomethyl modification enzyme